MSKDFERLCQIQDLRYRWRFFHTPSTQSFCQSCHPGMELATGAWSPKCHNFRFSFRAGVFNTQVETPPAQGIANTPLLIGGEHDERNTASLNGAQLRDAEPPLAE